MASVGHVAVGLAAARAYQRTGGAPGWRSALSWSALSLLPDADVIGFALGVDYGDPWGHRGATHSLVVAAIVGLAIGAIGRRINRRFLPTALVASLVLASHGLLDTMTDGGLGCALLWPFDLTRYFAPWRPIPVAPIGLALFSAYGAMVGITETLLFAPLLVTSLSSRHWKQSPAVAATLGGLWLGGVWLITSRDRMRETIIGAVLREDTAFTPGYSAAAFKSIEIGHSQEDVRIRLGPPLGERWFYSSSPSERAAATSAATLDRCGAIRFARGIVVSAFEPAACSKTGVVAGSTIDDVRRRLGTPRESCWQYSWSPRGGHYRARDICFVDSTVDAVIQGWR